MQQDNFSRDFPLVSSMAEPLHTQKRGNSLALWAIVIIIAIAVFFGIWMFLNSHRDVKKHPPVGTVTHSTPVGGVVLDGVFHPSDGDGGELDSIRWRI